MYGHFMNYKNLNQAI